MNAGVRSFDSSKVIENQADTLLAERIRQLYDSAGIGMAATLFNSIITVVVLRTVVPIHVLIIWLSCLWLVTLFRFVQVLKFRKSEQQHGTFDAHRYRRSFIVGLACSGIVWGSIGVFLFPQSSVPHQAFLAFVLGGMIAGAAGTFSSVLSAFYAYSIPALAPLTIRFFTVPDEIHLAMGLMALLFAVLISDTARRTNAAIVTSVEFRAKNAWQDASRLQAEEQLQRHQKDIDQLAQDRARTRKLQERNEYLEQHLNEYVRIDEERHRLLVKSNRLDKLESLSALSAGIASAFSNLLLLINGYTEIVLIRLPKDSPFSESLQGVMFAAKRATELMEKLRSSAGGLMSRVESTNVSKVTIDMSEEFAKLFKGKGAIQIEIKDNLPSVNGDPQQIRQVIRNLVENAVEALRSPQGTVRVCTEVVEATSEYLSTAYVDDELSAGPYVCVDVVDNGVGMSEDTKARMFDPFFTTKSHGRGLGLLTVMGIVRAHKGAVILKSDPGRGTSVRVLLPVESGG